MTKRKTLFTILIITILLILVLVGCTRKGNDVPVPANLAIKDGVLSWDAVTGAISYDVKVDETVYSTELTQYTIKVGDDNDHTVTVRANTYDGTSEYASPLVYARPKSTTELQQLRKPEIKMTKNRVMWDPVMNNNGYKIFFDGKTYAVQKNATYFDLEFTRDGSFLVTMQAIGDNVTFSSSLISDPYLLTVTNLQAKLQKLPQVTISFNPQTEAIEWSNIYSAETVTYEIYRNDESEPIARIPADSSKTKMGYKPTFAAEEKVSYKLQLTDSRGEDKLYDPSPYTDSLYFPITDAVPTDLEVVPDEESGTYRIQWSERLFSLGYSVQIDGGDPYQLKKDAAYLEVPALEAGRHVVRVSTRGDNRRYTASGYSVGIVFYTDENGVIRNRLATPKLPAVTILKDKETEALQEVVVRTSEVENANRYSFRISFGAETATFDSDEPTLSLTETKVGARTATLEEGQAIQKIFAALVTGIRVSVVALSDSIFYRDSLLSEEAYCIDDDKAEKIDAPTGFKFGGKTFVWNKEEGASYEIMMDGVLYDADSKDLVVTAGEHVAKIRKKGEGNLWSAEISFRSPFELAAPRDLEVTKGELSFTESENATLYKLYVNGVFLADLQNGKNVSLSSYIREDGRYLLTVVATADETLFCDSPFSEEYLYLKTDGEYGSSVKPYEPRNAEELLSLMRAHPTAYFSLPKSATYDFSSYDFRSFDRFTFGGTLRGNGAALKGISLTSALFEALRGATIEGLSFEISTTDFASTQNSILSPVADRTTLRNVSVSLSGHTTYHKNINFGLLFYEATDCVIEEVSVTLEDLTFDGDLARKIGLVAYSYEGSIDGLTIGGSITVGGGEVRFGGISLEGAIACAGYTSDLKATLTGSVSLLVAGATADGSVSGVFGTSAVFDLSAPSVTYYGVAKSGAALTGGAIGGKVTISDAETAFAYGVGESDLISLEGVTVSTLFDIAATTSVSAAGLARAISEECVTTGASFTGTILAKGALESTLAGGAIKMEGAHALSVTGTILAEDGNEALLAGGAISAESLTLTAKGKISAKKVLSVEMSGGAITASGSLSLSGSVEFASEECDEVKCSGVVEKGEEETLLSVTVSNFRAFGALGGEVVQAAGLSCQAESIVIESLQLTTDFSVKSVDAECAGALLATKSLTLPETGTISLHSGIEGGGSLAGFGLNFTGIDLSHLALSGNLTLKATNERNYLYGVADRVKGAADIDSALSLSTEGDVAVFGMFSMAESASNLTHHDAAVSLKSGDATYYGLIRTISDGAPEELEIRRISLSATPLSAGEGTIGIYGMTGVVSTLRNVTIADVSYEVGGYATLFFGGASEQITALLTDADLDYTLHTSALVNKVGGVAYTGKGSVLHSEIGGEGKAITLQVEKGALLFGGLYCAIDDTEITQSAFRFDLALDLPEDGTGVIGGLTPESNVGEDIRCTRSTVDLTVVRTGAGKAKIGGAVGVQSATLSGLKTTVNFTSAAKEDVLGGLSAEFTNNPILEKCVAFGSITAEGFAGGLVGKALATSIGQVDGCATALTILSTEGKAGGLFASASNLSIDYTYSIAVLPDKGAGLFAEGENLTFDRCYFAGYAHEYAIAESTNTCVSPEGSLYLDASLYGAAGLTVVGSGALADYEWSEKIRSFGYGYTEEDLGVYFTAGGTEYPYFYEVGSVSQPLSVNKETLTPISITVRTLDLFTLLPRFAENRTVSWVTDSNDRCLKVKNGVAVTQDNGTGKLYGILSGGAVAYEVAYTVTGFVPFDGAGTAEDPFLIASPQYLKYLREYSEKNPDYYYELSFEESTVEGLIFAEIFDEEHPFFDADHPFRGHLDFGGVCFDSPLFGEDGMLGFIEDSTITDLVLSGECGGTLLASSVKNSTLSGIAIDGRIARDARLVSVAENSTIESVTLGMTIRSSEDLTFCLIDEMKGGTLQKTSLVLSADIDGNISLFAIDEITSKATIDKVQIFYRIPKADSLTAAIVRTDGVGSDFSYCMLLAEASAKDAESEIAGLTLSSTGSAFENCAVLLSGDVLFYPLIKEGSATYDEVKVLYSGAAGKEEGVSYLTIAAAPAAFLALFEGLPEYAEGDLATPLGYAAFGEDTDTNFDSSESNITVKESVVLSALLQNSYSGRKPFSTMVFYSFSGDYAEISGDILRPRRNGSGGILTVTNLYGETVEIGVTVEDYLGFADGSGTEEDPYLIYDMDDLERMVLKSEESGLYFRIENDITGSTDRMAEFRGTLTRGASPVTLTITLSEDSLFEKASGHIEGINFVLNKDSASVGAGEKGGLFACEGDNLTLKDCAFTLVCSSASVGEGAAFGLLFGKLSDSALEEVTVTISDSCEIAAGKGSTVGVLAGEALESFFTEIAVTATITLTESEEADKFSEELTDTAIRFAVIGYLSASNATMSIIDAETDLVIGESYYAEDFVLTLTLTASAEELVFGGVAGESSVTIRNLHDSSVDLTVSGGTVVAGCVAGSINNANVTESSISGKILTGEETVKEGYFGGAVGKSSSGEVESTTIDVVITVRSQGAIHAGGAVGNAIGGGVESTTIDVLTDVRAQGAIYAGGAVGSGMGTLSDLVVTANVTAHSFAEEALVEALAATGGKYQSILSVGGAAGEFSGTIERVTVTVTAVTATCDLATDDLYVLAGGLAGSLREASDIEIKGTGTITATGGNAVASGGAAILTDVITYAVLSGVTLEGARIGGLAGILTISGNNDVTSEIYVALSGLSASVGALVGEAIVNDGLSKETLENIPKELLLSKGRYLSGKSVGTVLAAEQTDDLASLSPLSAFYAASLYTEFDEEIWSISEGDDRLPTLK